MIAQAKRKRAGKKSHVTRKINEINKVITNKGSMKKKLQEAMVLHEDLMLLLNDVDVDFSDIWIEELAANVDTCCANIDGYQTSRQHDP